MTTSILRKLAVVTLAGLLISSAEGADISRFPAIDVAKTADYGVTNLTTGASSFSWNGPLIARLPLSSTSVVTFVSAPTSTNRTRVAHFRVSGGDGTNTLSWAGVTINWRNTQISAPSNVVDYVFVTVNGELDAYNDSGITEQAISGLTTGYLPYATSATTLGDSPWYRTSTNSLGFNGVDPVFSLIGDPVNPNTFIGTLSGNSSLSGTINTFVGGSAGASLTTGSRNVGLGYATGASIDTANDNTFIGNESGIEITSGNSNVGVGRGSLYKGKDVSSAVSIGYFAGREDVSGVGNISVGASAGYYNKWGSLNTFVGTSAGNGAATISSNVSQNVFVGAYSGHSNRVSEATGVGYFTLTHNVTGVRNTALGWLAGRYTLGNDLVLLGHSTDTSTGTGDSSTNVIAIGSGVISQGSGTAQIGTNGVTVLYLNGTVGWFRGSGSPEGVVPATGGSYYSDETGYKLYVKESASGNTGWVVK